MNQALLVLEYGNVFLGLLVLAMPTPIGSVWWHTVGLAGLSAVFLAFLFALEVKLQETNNAGGPSFRSHATPGCWCCLLPSLISMSCWLGGKEKPSESCWQTALLGLGLLGASVLWLQSLVWKRSVSRGNAAYAFVRQPIWQVMAVSLVVGLAMVHLRQIGIAAALVTSLTTHGLFFTMTCVLPKAFSSSFTIGEMILLAQGGSLFIVRAVGDIAFFGSEEVDQSAAITLFAEVVLLICFLVICLVLALPVLRHPLPFYGLCLTAVMFIVLSLAWLLKENPIFWLINFLLATNIRVCLLLSWVLLSTLAAMVVVYQQFTGNQASTVTRKLFHALILFVYVPGLICDTELLRLASLLILAVFLLLECVRVLQVPPLGQVLNKSLDVFLDEKDAGSLILTPIYLLIGCSLPIWLNPNKNIAESVSLASWSGLLSIGIGDTVASVAGATVGMHQWPQSKKTLEGTTLSILAQFVFISFLGIAGWLPLQSIGVRSSLVIVTSSLMEAFTSQMDNLIVPLWTFLMFLLV